MNLYPSTSKVTTIDTIREAVIYTKGKCIVKFRKRDDYCYFYQEENRYRLLGHTIEEVVSSMAETYYESEIHLFLDKGRNYYNPCSDLERKFLLMSLGVK